MGALALAALVVATGEVRVAREEMLSAIPEAVQVAGEATATRA
jgi:hypothetical protein